MNPFDKLLEPLNVNEEDIASIISAVEKIEKSKIKTDKVFKVSFLRNYTIENIEPILKYRLFKKGIRPEITFGLYDNVNQEILNSGSHIYDSSTDLVVLSLLWEPLDEGYWKAGWNSKRLENEVLSVFNLLKKKAKSLIAVNTFIPPFYSEYGIYSSKSHKGITYHINKVNQKIREYVSGHSDMFILVDFERFTRELGENKSIDYRYWQMYKAPFKTEFLNLYAKEIAKIAAALKGLSKKCLILDCDNTLWGRIVGEDGLSGIKLDKNNYPGKAYYDFQKAVLKLKERGVILALCSKNNEADVMEVFEKHPYCLIKKADFSAWKINWKDKADNINALAEELNIGKDSIVYVDDNPVECGLVRKYLPEVTVKIVPKKLHNFDRLLFEEGLFDVLSMSKEDKLKNKLYRQEARRKGLKDKISNIDDYIRSLELTAVIQKASIEDLARISQLTQKTNQFNLTTKRYSAIEIANLMKGSCSAVFSLKLKDKYGDYGLTGVFIAKKDGKTGIIDSFLLSCRILGRKAESDFLAYCLRYLEKEWKITAWQAQYLPTPKNKQVENYWESCGFKAASEVKGIKTYTAKKESINKEYTGFIKFKI